MSTYNPDGSVAATYLPFFDGNGNVTGLTDASGQVVATYQYSVFGKMTATWSGPGAVDPNPFRFSTKYCDSQTGLYYYGLRYYSPNLQRWISRDPSGENGGVNLYAFCGNDPVNGVDALGLAFIVNTNMQLEDELTRGTTPPTTPTYDKLSIEKKYEYHATRFHIYQIRDKIQKEIDDLESIENRSGFANSQLEYYKRLKKIGGEADDENKMRYYQSQIDFNDPNNAEEIIAYNVFTNSGGSMNYDDVMLAASLEFQAKFVIGLSSLLGTIPSPSLINPKGYSNVSRWGRTGLNAGDWIMNGPKNLWNYRLSFKWQPGYGNIPATFEMGEGYTVPSSSVRWPDGAIIDGSWKGIFGQRMYQPYDETPPLRLIDIPLLPLGGMYQSDPVIPTPKMQDSESGR